MDPRRIEAREFAERVIDDPGYQQNLIDRITRGEANHMEVLLWQYRYGRPVEKIQVSGRGIFQLVLGRGARPGEYDGGGAGERASTG